MQCIGVAYFMVAQPKVLTKSLVGILSAGFLGFQSRRAVAVGLTTLACWSALALPSLAWVKMDSNEGINAALVFGMRNQHLSMSSLLGDNWIEGENGTLLNVYSPFMMLAAKATKAGFPVKPTKSDLEAARKRFARDVYYLSDTKNRIMVKFAVSFYGDKPDFAKTYFARIVGSGRGKDVTLKPEKQHLDDIADPISNGESSGKYEAINSYYFLMSDLLNVDEFTLYLESPNGAPLAFRMKSDRLY